MYGKHIELAKQLTKENICMGTHRSDYTINEGTPTCMYVLETHRNGYTFYEGTLNE